MKGNLTGLLKDIEYSTSIWNNHRSSFLDFNEKKRLYVAFRKDIINIYSLQKGEFTYYYAMQRERTLIAHTN